MLWSPPHSRKLSERLSKTAAWLSFVSCCACGCASVQQLNTAVTQLEESAGAPKSTLRVATNDDRKSGTPEFDELPAPPKTVVDRPAPDRISAPRPFAWTPVGQSTGGRPFQTKLTGKDGYRTLVVGSVGGHDPVALELTDRLGRHLHENSPILGGFESLLIRTINPDGAANQKHVNQAGDYVNSHFPDPRATAETSVQGLSEVRFLQQQLKQFQPQRVIHLRSVQRKRGVVAFSSGPESVAREIAEWLNFDVVQLGAQSGPGSLERYIALRGDSQMITIGIPAATDASKVWELYGDAILNLLLSEDLATRDIARRQQEQNSASRSDR